MTTATETKTFSPGDRVYYSSPDSPGRITGIAKGAATVQVEDGRTVIVPVAKLTPLPELEREWQVGDRVRIISSPGVPKDFIGDVGIIAGIGPSSKAKQQFVVELEGGQVWVSKKWVELAEEEGPDLKVGDRVRITKAPRCVGELATVKTVETRGLSVLPDSGMFTMAIARSGVELVEAAPASENAADNNAEPIHETEAEALTTATHTPGFLSPNLANRLLEFSQGLDWQQNQFRIYGKEMPLPRLEIMFGDPGCTYRYGNVTLSPLPWPPELQALREQVEAATGQSYQVVIGNLYRSGADHIGYHSDDSPEMGENPAIASISLGATRSFDVRHVETKTVTRYDLGSGDLVFMPPGFQGTHKHRLAKTTKEVGLRINWTFRPHVGGAAPAVEAEIVTTEPIARLAELEADITEGLGLIEQGKAKIWAAVAAVRSEELWRVAGHPSFEAYCADRWNWKKANGHENALAGEVLTELLESGVPVEAVPTSTSAMSQLAKAPAGDRAEVLQKAATLNGGKVTEAAVRQALKPEPTAEDELRSAGIPVYRPDTSEAAIAEGLARGWLAPTTEQPPSPADSAHATASPADNTQSSTETPPPALEPSGEGYEVGTRGTLKDYPHSFVVAARTGNSLELWNATQRMRVHASEFTPCTSQKHPYELETVARHWLRDMVDALGPEQVQALLGEVVK